MPEGSRYSLEMIRELAKDMQSDYDTMGDDWRSKLEELHVTIKRVKEWQERIFDKFGRPRVEGQDEFGRRWLDVRPGQVVKLEEADMEHVKFEGATLVQGLGVDLENSEKALVTYKAVMMIDEHHFLRKMLPKTTSIPLHDPQYNLITVQIEVPRAELAQESILSLGDIMESEGEKHYKTMRQIRNTGRWFSRHWQATSILVVTSLIVCGLIVLAEAASKWMAEQPVQPAAPVYTPGFNTTTNIWNTPLITGMGLAGIPLWFWMVLFMFPMMYMLRNAMR